MKTTLVIDDQIMRRIKAEAARRGTTISELVEAALRRFLMPPTDKPAALPPLPVFHGGAPLVDLDDREALYEILDAERDRELYGRGGNIDPARPLDKPST
jgi:hypothetical protein